MSNSDVIKTGKGAELKQENNEETTWHVKCCSLLQIIMAQKPVEIGYQTHIDTQKNNVDCRP